MRANLKGQTSYEYKIANVVTCQQYNSIQRSKRHLHFLTRDKTSSSPLNFCVFLSEPCLSAGNIPQDICTASVLNTIESGLVESVLNL